MLVRRSRALGALTALALLAGCGSGGNETSTSAAETGAETASPATDPGSEEVVTTDSLVPDTAPASSEPTGTDPAGASTPANPNVPAKPEVKLPSTLPTELVVTDLVAGSGAEAKEGDTVVVHYVGVRSADGTEFDNSYDRGQPFPVVLGSGSVIAGWEQGLIGAQAGARRQLDIPADLAYGDQDQGDVIKAGDALSFVVDVMAVIPPSDPADAPTVTVTAAENTAEASFSDLVTGDGAEVTEGATVAAHIIAFRADTGEQIDSSWETGTPVNLIADKNQLIEGLASGLVGMKTGGRRQMVIPYAQAFGDAGNPDLGLPEKTDLILVVDVIAVY